VAVSLVELCVVHLLIALLWSGWVALALTLISLSGMVWLIALVRSFRTRPVELTDDRLLMRAGFIKAIDLPRANVLRLRSDVTGAEVKAAGTLRLSLLAYPNIVIDLVAPVSIGRRRVTAVAHRLDDADAFAQAFGIWRLAA
jgi:hypothetical protein